MRAELLEFLNHELNGKTISEQPSEPLRRLVHVISLQYAARHGCATSNVCWDHSVISDVTPPEVSTQLLDRELADAAGYNLGTPKA